MGLLSRLELGDFRRVKMNAEEARRLAVETNQPFWHSGALAIDAMANGLRGDNARAQELAAEAEQIAVGHALKQCDRMSLRFEADRLVPPETDAVGVAVDHEGELYVISIGGPAGKRRRSGEAKRRPAATDDQD